jgi:uncharacterized protein YbjT (DUF2867 family)
MNSSPRTALLAGASGLVGSHVLQELLASPVYEKVTVLVRKPLAVSHPKLVQVTVDFERFAEYREHFRVDDVFCCLGTTIKIAKTKEAFERVDHHYPLEMGRLAAGEQAGKFLIITALGSDAESRIFYNQVKGRVERDLQNLPLRELDIFRPSLLLGERADFRLGERVASRFAFAMVGPLAKYKPIHAATVARAMVRVAGGTATASTAHTAPITTPAVHIYESSRIQTLGS